MSVYTVRRFICTVLTYAIVLAAVAIAVFPLYWLVSTSLKYGVDALATPPILIPTRLTLENYRSAFGEQDMGRYLANSLIVSVASTVGSVLFGTLAAYALSKTYLAYGVRQGMLAWVLLTRMFPPVTLLIPYYVIVRRVGLSDTHLGLILTYMAYGMPFAIWLMVGFFQELPADIERAAVVDGCGLWQRFRLVVLPLTLPGLAVAAIFAFIGSWNEFIFASMLTSNVAKTLPVVISGYIGDKFLRWGEMSALGSAMVVPVLIVSLFTQRYLVRGLTFGAVKG